MDQAMEQAVGALSTQACAWTSESRDLNPGQSPALRVQNIQVVQTLPRTAAIRTACEPRPCKRGWATGATSHAGPAFLRCGAPGG
ncbi:unnamed protein product [Rangifer tarandus platyrhynchus]|uniref:Uncharacterized protein n=1 Tax=Rangifer tarandus platyrhynchus TaxID=3082113 RepID=A0AC59YWP1_RANTA